VFLIDLCYYKYKSRGVDFGVRALAKIFSAVQDDLDEHERQPRANTNTNPERTRTRTPTQSERERDLDRNHERCKISSLARAREKTNTPLVHAHQPAADAAKSVRPSIPPSTFPRLYMVLGANSH
jgi:hypothetical protein